LRKSFRRAIYRISIKKSLINITFIISTPFGCEREVTLVIFWYYFRQFEIITKWPSTLLPVYAQQSYFALCKISLSLLLPGTKCQALARVA
jgi:hypothetical protein